MRYSEFVQKYHDYCQGKPGAKPHGRCGNISYKGYDFISYNTIVARDYTGQKLRLATSHHYSASTENHLKHCGWDFRVPQVDLPASQRNMDYFIKQIQNELARVCRARIHTSLQDYYKLLQELRRYCHGFGLPYPAERVTPQAMLTDKQLAKLVMLRLNNPIPLAA